MPAPHRLLFLLSLTFLAVAATLVAPRTARAEATIVVDVESGKVLQAENATYPWYPASITKLMTAYVTLKAIKDGRITLDSLYTVSPIAAAQSPSKMGFRPGTQVTVDNALKMMMVKSANDMAVVLAEGLDGSIEKFCDEMNKTAQRLGMTQTSYVNPNGLPADGQITSARDMAILARAIIHDLPEYEYFVHIPAIKFGKRITRNINRLIGRYPGADGMKTGFICAAGYNLVASATRNGRRLLAIVLGAPSSEARSVKAMQLLEQGFSGNPISWLTPSLGTVDALVPIAAAPPNLRDDICGPKRKHPAVEDSDEDTIAVNGSDGGIVANSFSLFTAAGAAQGMKPSQILAIAPSAVEPVVVYTGPTKTGAALVAAVAVDTEAQTPKPKGKAKRATTAKLTADKSAADKPAGDRVAGTKRVQMKLTVNRTPPDKPVAAAATAKPAEKPSTPPAVKRAAKPATKPANAKLAAKRSGEKPKDAPKLN